MITEERGQRFQDVISHRFQDVIVLENIHDPHNALAAIRNCDAFGIQTAHVVFETEKIFNPKELGKVTSSSANKWVDTVCWEKSADCYSSLREQGFKIIATIIDPKAKTLSEIDFNKQKNAIVFGNEGFGISETAKKMADELVYIPMSGFVDSINLSVSVGVMLYELSRQRQKKNSFCLTHDEQTDLFRRWSKIDLDKKLRAHGVSREDASG
ncbi:RNA methyltransferase [Candidatus Roizmanbacteria bacterium]|nr:RNA methyltransferase [Candidatus Roizmanbacteria bacterium]